MTVVPRHRDGYKNMSKRSNFRIIVTGTLDSLVSSVEYFLEPLQKKKKVKERCSGCPSNEVSIVDWRGP